MQKKTVLILGSSHKNSIGTLLGAYIQKDGYNVVLSSRYRHLICDITNPKQVETILSLTKPDIVLCCVGTFIPPLALGEIPSWNKINDHLRSRTLGSIILLNTIIKFSRKPKIIFITGKVNSKDPSFGPYVMANAAIAQLKQFVQVSFPQIQLDIVTYHAIQGTYMAEMYKQKKDCAFLLFLSIKLTHN